MRPRNFVPVHGEFRMLQAHARLAEAAGVPAHAVRIADNGTILELDGDGLSVVGQIDAGTILVDGLSVGNVRDVVLRDRRHLASDGVLIVVATIAADTAEVMADPEIIVRGFDGPADDARAVLEQARDSGRAGARGVPGPPHHRGPPGAAASSTTRSPSCVSHRPASGRWCCPSSLRSEPRRLRPQGARIYPGTRQPSRTSTPGDRGRKRPG